MKKIPYFFSMIFILVGLGIILYPKISNYLVRKNQVEMIRVYQENVSGMEKKVKELEYEKAKKYNEKIKVEFLNASHQETVIYNYEEILNLSDNGIMSYIEIPKIKVYLPIYHGTKEEIMKKGVGHIPNTSLPIGGISTHCVLTGHTGLLRTEIFTRLNELEVNDYFYIYTLDDKLSYKVGQIKVVLPTELGDLQRREGKDLVTLVTCTPYGINTHRLLVQGERTGENESLDNTNQGDVRKKVNFQEDRNNRKYYLIGILCGLILFFMIILCCILFHSIVKYIRK